MRKSFISAVLALALVLSMALPVFAAEEEDAFLGTWIETIAQRGIIEITKEDGAYKIEVAWPSSAFERSVWNLTGTLNEEGNAIVYKTGSYSVHTFDEEGNFTESENRVGLAGTMELRDGKIYWTEAGSEDAEPSVFEKAEFIEPETRGADRFDDVARDDYFFDAVDWALENGVTDGRSETLFAPGSTCTRAEAVTFLWRYAGQPAADKGGCGFTDLEAGSWYEAPVWWAFANKITDGMNDATFAPKGTTTRAQVITFLYRTAGEPEVSGTCPFKDVPAGSWFEKPVIWAYENGMFSEDNIPSAETFAPNEPCRRADIVTFMYLASKYQKDAEEDKQVYANQFAGPWMDRTSGRASMTIVPKVYGEFAELIVKISWGNSASETAEYTMNARFDEKSGEIVYSDGALRIDTYSGEGALTGSALQYEGSKGSFRFDGDVLKWTDDREERSAEMVFERMEHPAPGAEQLAGEYFKLVAGIMPGSAGSSLREAEAFYKAVDFSWKNDLWGCESGSLRDNMLKAYESLTEDERTAFDEGFMGILGLDGKAFGDYAAVKGSFEDAGVSDMMEKYSVMTEVRMCWDRLKSFTLTLGNSEI